MTLEIKNIAAALAKAQAEMGKALKDKNNPAFKSKYADLGAVMDACIPALNKNGIAVLQPFHDDGVGGRGVKTVLIHESGEVLECTIPLIVGKNDMQGLGSAITYARRYGLMSMAGIAPEDDDGNAAVASVKDDPPPAPMRPAPASDVAVQTAVESLSAAERLDQLAAIWGDLPPVVRAAPAVVRAKDTRKAALAAKPNDDLGGDSLPY